MLKNIINTIGSKLIIAACSFALLLLNSNFLGAEGLGSVGLIVLSITIVLLFSNLIHTSIVYYASRVNNSALLIVSYLWAIISVIVCFALNYIYPFFPKEFEHAIYGLALLQSCIVIHLNILLSKERITTYNLLNTFQSLILLFSIVYFYHYQNNHTVEAFIQGLYLSYISIFIISFFLSVSLLDRLILKDLKPSFWLSITYGFHLQSANVFQLLNYRISYFILDAFSGRASLGIYTAGVQLSESLLLPGKSISTVQYARISARKSDRYALRVSLMLMKLSFILTSIGMLLLLLVPENWLIHLLGNSFEGVKAPLFAMSLGIVALSAEVILSHYFSGTGRQKVNSSSALIGLLLTISTALVLIPKYAAVGAAISASIAFSGMLIFMAFRIYRSSHIKISDFFLKKEDIQLFKRLFFKQ